MSYSQDAVLFLKSEIDRLCKEYHSGNEPYTKKEKSIAFSRWFCENILFIPKVKIDDVVAIDGSGDYSVDLFDIQDTDNPEIVWAQVKHAEDLDHEVTREEMVELGETPHYLKSKPVDANAIFKQKSAEFNQIGGMDSEQYSKRIIFVVAGKLSPQAQNLIETPEWKNKWKNNKGLQFERWSHTFGCRQWFNVARNTTTDEIIKIYHMGKDPPEVTTNEPSTPCGEPSIGSGNFSTNNRSS